MTMRDVMAEFYDGPHATPAPAVEGPIYLGIKNMTEDGHLDLSQIRHIAESDYATWTRRVEPRPGDVIFTYEASLHRYAIVPVGFRGTLGRRVALLRPKNDTVDTRFLLYSFISPVWRATVQRRINVGSTVDRLPLTEFPMFPIRIPPLLTQRKIAAILSAYDDLIENNNRRIQLLEEMAQRIYREWFVDFRYPGHEHVPLVNSELGPIPECWVVRRISEIASPERYAVTSGPFGSKLGRKDYLTQGVPVIRGTNLSVGGAFRDTDFVFVSEAKADAMPSCQAHPGDILVTQRGTLGQVGIIPPEPRFPRYVISQSQMKITVDPAVGSGQYLYAAIRSPEVTARLQAQAMTAGVPHINLSILRNFQVVWPTLALQNQLQPALRLFAQQVETLNQAIENARATRDVLLPRLISGEVDVTAFGIAIPEAAA
jgi:type I restriction enzyme, S subunit